MKKFKLFALLFLAGTMVFTSCNKDEEEIALPTITFSGASSYEIDFADSTTTRIVYNVDVKADGKVDQFTITEKKYLSDNTTVSTAYDSDKTDDFKGETAKTYNFDKTFIAGDFVVEGKEVSKIEYIYSVTDKEGKNVEKICTVTKKQQAVTTPLSDATDFTWQRVGGAAGTGLSSFGLKWTSNAKETHAQITKDTAEKLVILTAADWTNITTKEDLAAAVEAGTDADVYDGVSTTASGTYDDVIATKVGNEYFLIHITSGDVQTGNAGTTVTITGQSKN